MNNLTFPESINITAKKNEPTPFSFLVHSNYNSPQELRVIPNCTCTTAEPRVILQPMESTKVNLSIKRTVSGIVNLTLVHKENRYQVKLITTVI